MILRALLFTLCLAVCHAQEKPLVYNHMEGEESPLGKAVVEALKSKVTIIEIPATKDYVRPKAISGHVPRAARTSSGESLQGSVVAGYVVTVDGKVAEPVIVKSSDERLNEHVLKAMEGWRLRPATLKGVSISTMAAQEFNFEAAPEEFIEQILEPTGGKILRPKDWFYAEAHRKSGYQWTISREDQSGNKPYSTGVRIQLFADVKAGTGKTAEQFIKDFVERKKKDADKVLSSCEPKEQYLFTRICLETEEGPYRILYSLFWGSDDLDIAVVSIAGTPKELWDTYAPTFEKMGSFELIDMKRFEK